MKDKKPFDFSGWVTVNNVLCSDGRTIMPDAFAHNDGMEVPLVWNHQHNDVFNILGKVLLENKPKGVYGYGYLNDTVQGQNAREQLQHGDIKRLSIYANHLKQNGGNVTYGDIKEVSLVVGAANPGAFIDSVTLAHSADVPEEEGIVYTDETLELYHADDEEKKEEKKPEPKPEKKEDDEEVMSMEEVRKQYESMSEKQQEAVNALVGLALSKDARKIINEDEEEEEDVKHNAFDNDVRTRTNYLSHSDQAAILDMAKTPAVGSLKAAMEMYAEETGATLMHADDDPVVKPSSGFDQDTAHDGNITWLFPEFRDVRPGAPEMLTNDQGWVTQVMNKVHKLPFSRVRTRLVDIRNLEALRAKGYEKGTEKTITGNFTLLRRETDPQTVYVSSALNRDDIIDITEFDYVQYLYNIDRMNLNEELAMAIMLGDFREDGAEGKIYPTHIRPIWTDDDLYTIHVDLDVNEVKERLVGEDSSSWFGENYAYAEGLIEAALYARENFKGTGSPDFFVTPHMVNVMLLARDMNGRRLYQNVGELASALNVNSIITAEQFANRIRTDGNSAKHKLLGIMVNLADYSVGSTKGGEITHFTDFDIKFNQNLSLLETRLSGALTRAYSAIVIEEPYSA